MNFIALLKNKKLFDYIFCLLAFSIPLSTAIPNIFLGLLIPIFATRIKEVDWFQYLKGTNGILLALYLYLFLVISINSNIIVDLKFLSRFLIFIILPLLGSLISNKNHIKLALVAGIGFSLIVSTYLTLQFYFSEGELPFGNNKFVNEILILERPYLGFLCGLNILLSLELTKAVKPSYIYKYLLYFSAFYSFAFIFLISAKMSIISVSFILLIGFYRLSIKSNTKKLILLGVLLIIGLVISFNSNIKKRFYIEESFDKTLTKAKIYEPRFTIWDCGIDILNSSVNILLFGVGSFEKSNEELINCYGNSIENPSKKEYYISEGFNSHNQFLDLWLSAGLLSLLLILGYFLYFLKIGFNNYYSLSIIILFISFFMVENIFHRQLGCYLLGILGILASDMKNIRTNAIKDSFPHLN